MKKEDRLSLFRTLPPRGSRGNAVRPVSDCMGPEGILHQYFPWLWLGINTSRRTTPQPQGPCAGRSAPPADSEPKRLTRSRWFVIPLFLCLLMLSACTPKGNPLPDGMEESELLDQGRAVVSQLNEGDYQSVYYQLRQDAQESTSPEEIEQYVAAVLDRAGERLQETQAMATGQQLDTGEAYGTAVLCCRHRKKNVVYRVAFDTSMELMGITLSTR